MALLLEKVFSRASLGQYRSGDSRLNSPFPATHKKFFPPKQMKNLPPVKYCGNEPICVISMEMVPTKARPPEAFLVVLVSPSHGLSAVQVHGPFTSLR
jgi:hypothetical protein